MLRGDRWRNGGTSALAADDLHEERGALAVDALGDVEAVLGLHQRFAPGRIRFFSR